MFAEFYQLGDAHLGGETVQSVALHYLAACACEEAFASREGKNSPIFKYQVLIEGLEGGVGEGYSKKESQQLASKITLQQLKRKPQFIDAVFIAKGNRTKMEEEPVLTVPDTEQKADFIIPQAKDEGTAPVYSDKVEEKKVVVKEKKEADEFDFSDIQATPKEVTSEDIIAASMAEAYKE